MIFDWLFGNEENKNSGSYRKKKPKTKQQPKKDVSKGYNKIQYAIKKQIENWVESKSGFLDDYDDWYIGVTNNPTRRKSEHEENYDIEYFKYWNAQNSTNALVIERSFGWKKAGMWGGGQKGNARSNSKFVYVFKHN